MNAKCIKGDVALGIVGLVLLATMVFGWLMGRRERREVEQRYGGLVETFCHDSGEEVQCQDIAKNPSR